MYKYLLISTAIYMYRDDCPLYCSCVYTAIAPPLQERGSILCCNVLVIV